MTEAEEVIARLSAERRTVAVAESLTGGMLAAALTAVPGASAVFLGGVVAYTAELKSRLLAVPAELIEAAGVVSGPVAEAMAAGVRVACGADWGIATTGAAGPDPHGGQPAGTVWIGVCGPSGPPQAVARHFAGGRDQVRRHAVTAAFGQFLRSG